MRMSIHIVTNDRLDCLALLIESLRKQTFKEWDLVILDNSKDPNKKVEKYYPMMCLLNRIQFEGHRVQVIDNSADTGPRDIGRYRNMIIEKDEFNNQIGCRLDDDSIIESNYLEIIEYGFKTDLKVAIVGGIVPYFWLPIQHALIPARFNEVTKFYDWTDNCVHFYRMLNDVGLDRHWKYTYYDSGHVRSCYAYKMDVAKQIKFPEYTGSTGFTEETTFCIKAWILGYRVLINPNAIAWHLNVPYGGGRDTIHSQQEMDEIKLRNIRMLKEDLDKFRTEHNVEAKGYP